MAATLSGKVAVYGIDATLAFTGMLKTFNILKGTSLSESGREAKLERNGHIVGGAKDLVTRQVSFTFVPYDSSNPSTLATAKSKIVLPPVLGQLTVADSDITLLDGTWTSCGTPTISFREDGYAEITVTGEKYLQADATFKDLASITA